MRKFLVFLIIAVLAISGFCFATDTVSENDSDEYDSNVVKIDNYDDFYDAYQNGYTQDELKEYYRDYLVYSREQEELTEQDVTSIKAKVVDVSEEKITYGLDYYTPYKISYQPIKVRVVEGEYEGKVLDVKYILTADTYGNIKVDKVSLGDTIFITLDTQDGELTAYATSYDTRNVRFSGIIVLLFVLACLMILVGKVKGFKMILLIALVFDLVFVITLPQVLKHNEVVTIEKGESNFPTLEEIDNDETISILDVDENAEPTKVEIIKRSSSVAWLIVLDVIVISAVCLINNLGLTRKTLYAFVVTICMLVFAVLLILGTNSILKNNGTVFEAASMTENVINRNIDFNTVYVFTVMIMASILIPSVVSKVFDNYDSGDYKEKMQGYLMMVVGILVVLLLITLIFKTITLVIFRYNTQGLLNSEMLTSEVVRIIVLGIATIITMPLAEFVAKKSKTYKAIEAPKE